MNDPKTLRLLTLALMGVWVVSLIVRIYQPGWQLGPAVDGLVTTAVAFWFSREGLKKETK